MSSYFCILNIPGVPVREIAVLKASDDAAANAEARGLTALWPGFETVVVYHGERIVSVIANPDLGFAQSSLWLDCAA